MKNFYLFIILINFNLVFSQQTKIKYDFETTFSKELLEDKNIGFYMEGAQKGAKQIKLELIYNDSISSFKIQNALSINEEFEMAQTLCDCKQKIFQKKGYSYTNNSDLVLKKEKYIIKDTIKNKWQITSESIKLNNFTCYKAQMTENIVLGNGTIKEKAIIAWFAPELSSNFGPAGFGNLPGTILILQNGDMIFKATEILTNVNDELSFDLKGEIISNDEYAKISEKAFLEAMEGN